MINLFMRLWCTLWGHGRIGYTVHNDKIVTYCKRCKHEIKLDTRGSLFG